MIRSWAIGCSVIVLVPTLLAAGCSDEDAAATPYEDPDGGTARSTTPAATAEEDPSLDASARDAGVADVAPRDAAPEVVSDAAPPPYARCTPGGPCQDLALDAARLASSIFIETRDVASTSCSVAEGTIFAAGRRRLLRFTTYVTNVGTADLLLGDPAASPSAFHFATCHGHWHFRDYADYSLRKLDGTLAVQGHKESFCVEDNVQGTGRDLKPRAPQTAADAAPPPDTWDEDTQTNCLHPGLHMGWSDAYFNTTEGNWLDITGLPTGDYELRVTINPLHTIDELDFTNDAAAVTVHVPDASADGDACPATSDAIYRCNDDFTKRSRCVQGVTTTETCASGTSCVQFTEIAHSAVCQ